MNMLSPFVPQDSGVIPAMHDMIDGTGGQYEGFNYLGVGILALAVISLVLNRRALWPMAVRYRYLLILLIAFTGFALSFNPMIGDIALLHPFAHAAATPAWRAAFRPVRPPPRLSMPASARKSAT